MLYACGPHEGMYLKMPTAGKQIPAAYSRLTDSLVTPYSRPRSDGLITPTDWSVTNPGSGQLGLKCLITSHNILAGDRPVCQR